MFEKLIDLRQTLITTNYNFCKDKLKVMPLMETLYDIEFALFMEFTLRESNFFNSLLRSESADEN